MKSRNRWKEIERFWAEQLGGKRVPVTGRQRGDMPDVDSPLYSIEVKAGRVMSARLRLGMRQAQAAAVKTGKIPLLCVSQSLRAGEGDSEGKPGRPGSEHYILIRLEDWLALNGPTKPELETIRDVFNREGE